MSKYSKTNLLKIESSSQTKGLEAHFARKYMDSRDLGVSLFRYEPNYKTNMGHSHKVQEEAYVVVNGSGHLLLDKEVLDLELWDVVRVAPEVVRGFEAGPNGLDILAVGGPKPEEGDGVRQTLEWPSN